MKKYLFLFLLPIVQLVNAQCLSGTYTIGGTSPDYTNITTAVTALTTNGVCGPVVFNIRSGTYTGQIIIPQITGSTSVNTITFQSEALDSTAVSIEAGGTPTNNSVIKLDGGDHIKFHKLKIKNTATSFICVFLFQNSSDNITISNSIIENAINSSALSVHKNQMNSASTDNENYTIINNYFSGGARAINFQGVQSTPNAIVLSGNNFQNQNENGVNLSNVNSALVFNNLFNYTSSITGTALAVTACKDSAVVSGNKINLVGGRAMSVGSSGPPYAKLLVSNNCIKGSGDVNGISAGGSSNILVCHNTVELNATNWQNSCFYTSTTTCIVNNNIFYQKGSAGKVFYGSTFISDYNNIYGAGSIYRSTGNVEYVTFNDWKTITGNDLNSIYIRPQFVSPTDFHISSDFSQNLVLPYFPSVPTDIEGTVRDNSSPYFGAYEFFNTPNLIDASVSQIINPVQNNCLGNQQIKILLKNYGVNNLTSATINWSVNNIVQTPFSWTGNLNYNDTTTALIGNFNFLNLGSYAFKVWTSNPNGSSDSFILNDSVISPVLYSSLSGTYTVGGASPNFTTLSSVVTSLNTRGVCGNVIFNLRAGTYSEGMLLGNISGVSGVNTITFQSESGISSSVTVYNPSGITFNLLGADNVTIRNMTVGGNGFVAYPSVYIGNGSNNIEVSNCTISATSSQNALGAGGLTSGSISNIRILNNTFNSGNYNINFNAGGGYKFFNVKVENNTFNAPSNGSIFLSLVDTLSYQNNIITGTNSQGPSSFFSYTTYATIKSNKFYSSDKNALELQNMNYALVANNMIVLNGTTASNAFITSNSQNLNFINNSLYSSNTNILSAVFNISSSTGNNKFWNNIIRGTGAGSVIRIGASSTASLKKNVYSGGGANFGNYKGTNTPAFSQWQAIAIIDTASFIANPFYTSATDLHANEIALKNAGVDVSAYITNDYDGQLRDATPDIGADEFTPFNIDAGTNGIVLNAITCAGNTPIQVYLKNNGTSTLTSAQINCKINTNNIPAYNWTGSLASGMQTLVNIASYNFVANTNYTIKAWSSNPNNQTDTFVLNDTSSKENLQIGLSGTYTIGGATPDFVTINNALTALKNGGVCGPVIFNIRNGVYTEQLKVLNIKGVSANNTITFQSENLDSSLVSIEHSASAGFNYTVNIDSADYIIFNKIGFKSLNSSYCHVITLTNLAKHCQIKNCAISAPSISGTLIDFSANSDSCLVSTCKFYKGFTGINYNGKYERAINNYFENQYSTGINASGLDFDISSNIFSCNRGSAITISGTSGGVIAKNKITFTAYYASAFGIAISNNFNTINIVNNFISVNGGSGINVVGSTNSNIINNSVYQIGNGKCFGLNGSTNLSVLNNIFYSSYNGSYCQTISGVNTNLISNYNCIKSSNNSLIYYNTTGYSSLSTYNGATGHELNSISVDPLFNSYVDLHITNAILLNGKAVSNSLATDDIDGQVRNLSTPDIGADEFTPLNMLNDVQVLQTYFANQLLCGGNIGVYAKIKNMGIDTLRNVTLTVNYLGITYTPVIWNGLLAQGQIKDSIFLGTVNNAYGNNSIKVWSELPNGVTDQNTLNDTLTSTPPSLKLNGSYTIGGVSPHFINITAANTALSTFGICGPVVFNIRAGNYTEDIQFYNISGSSGYTITFQSEMLDSSLVAINGTGVNSYVINLNNASNLILKKLTISSSSFANISNVITGTGSNIKIYNCRVVRNLTTDRLISVTGAGLKLDSNYFEGAATGVRIIAVSNGAEVTNNYFKDQSAIGFESDQAQLSKLTGNIVNTTKAISNYKGISVRSNNLTCTIAKNKITANNGHGMEVSLTNNAKIYNNYIHVTPIVNNLACLGLYLNNSISEVYNNTIIIDHNYMSSSAFYNNYPNANLKIKYNVIINKGNGYAYWSASQTTALSDTNCFFSNGNSPFKYNNINYGDLNAFSAISSLDIHSIEKMPYFNSDSTYSVTDADLYNKAGRIGYITDDIDGDIRAGVTTCLGADEFSLIQLDALVDKIIFSDTVLCDMNSSMLVRIRNFGVTPITQLTINWKFNGVLQTPFNWNGNLATTDSAIVNLGSYNPIITSANTIQVYTTQPNGLTDLNVNNDTVSFSIVSKMSGQYTIGGTSPDFTTFNAAVSALNNLGVCGPVTFKVRDGNYDERIEILPIKGTSNINTITFESESNDSSKVVLFNSPPINSNFYSIVSLKADHILIKGITVLNTTTYNMPALTIAGVRDIEISNCVISSPNNSGSVFTYNSPTTGFTNARILNNHFTQGNGTKATIVGSSSPVKPWGVTVSGNTFDVSANSLNISGFDTLSVIGNTCSSNMLVSELGADVYIEKNSIKGALNISNCVLGTNMKRIVSNNILSSLINIVNSNNLSILNNTVAVLAPPTSGIIYNPCFKIDNISTGNIIKNNLFYNKSRSVVYFIAVPGNNPFLTNVFDYNNLYSNCDTIVYQYNIGYVTHNYYSSLHAWQSASGNDAHSINVLPNFVSLTDFHLNNDVNINNKGVSLTEVTTDYDGQLRSLTAPDIGADEFNAVPLANDAAILGPNPNTTFCEGVNSMLVRIKNNGSNALSSVNIGWKVNNVAQTTFNWNGNLAPDSTVLVNIGNTTMVSTSLYNISFYTSSPNNVVDLNPLNDTVDVYNLRSRLSGVYTIGGVNPTFTTFNDAISALAAAGVCGPVVFNVRNGIYNEDLTFYPIIGVSNLNTITFQSESGNKTGVLVNTSTSSNDIPLKIIDADYLIFKDLSFKNTSSYSRVVSVIGDADNIILRNNILEGSSQNGSNVNLDYFSIIYFSGNSDSCIVEENILKRGTYGVSFDAPNLGWNNVVRKNTSVNPYLMGVYVKNQTNIIIDSNVINKLTPSSSYTATGISGNGCSGNYKIINNAISGAFSEGISFWNSPGTISNQPLIANNAIAGASNMYTGMKFSSSSYLKIFYNSVNLTSTQVLSTSIIIGSGTSNVDIKNNQFIIQGGYSIQIEHFANIGNSDYNNFYTSGTNLAKIGNSTNYTTLAAFTAATGKDLNSISTNPQFLSDSDLHYTNATIDGKATPLVEVTTDIQNQLRHISTPNIGAYEGPGSIINDSINKYLVLTKINTNNLSVGNNIITATIAYKLDPLKDTNYYSSIGTIDSLRIHYKINHFTEVVETWHGSLAFKDSLVYTFNTQLYIPNGKLYDLKVWFENLNPNHVEVNLADDSLVKRYILPMSGTYTIGGNLPDFINHGGAYNSLLFCGSSSRVKFLFRPGSYGRFTYQSNYAYPSHNGLIEYTSESGNANDVSIDLTWLDKLDSMKFSNLTIFPITGGSTSYPDDGVQISSTRYTEFDSCKFIGGTTPHERGGLFFFRQSGGVTSVIRNCLFKNLRYAFNLSNFDCYTSNSSTMNFTFENNIIDSCDKGVLIKEFVGWSGKKVIIKNNTISVNNNGIEVSVNGCDGLEISNNFINSKFDGLYFNANAYNAKLINNMINCKRQNYINLSSNMELYYNTFNALTTFTNVNTSITLNNNIFSTDSAYYALHLLYPAPITIISNNNNYYAPNYTHIARIGKINYPSKIYTLSSIQQMIDSLQIDTNSVNFDPMFISSSDLHAQTSNLQGMAKPISFVTTDIDGDSRLLNAPDIGADEINLSVTSVWPGDANHDSIANNNDLLPIGLYYSQTGSPRSSVSNLWQSYASMNWGTNQSNGADIKHADCNGDGVIDDNDTLAINLNFASTHTVAPNYSNNRAIADMYFYTTSGNYIAGDWINVDVMLGTSAVPVTDLYGIAFNIDYDASLVQSGTASISYPNSWLAQPGVDGIKIFKIDEIANTAYGAITRIDHTNKDGYGKIATFRFQASTSIGTPINMVFSFSGYEANDSSGVNIVFNPVVDSIHINPLSTSVVESGSASGISIYPNPYSGNTQIAYSLETSSNVSIEVYNTIGQKMETIVNANQKAGDYKYSFSAKEKGHDAGVYFVRITIDGTTTIRKIVEMK